MSLFLQFTVIGVAVGAAYAIYATGLVVTNTTSGVFNFAHGAVGMVAAFGYLELQDHHVNNVLSLIIVLLVGAPLAGAVVESVFMRQLHGATAERPIMVTLGLLLILLGIGQLVWSSSGVYQVNPLVNGSFSLSAPTSPGSIWSSSWWPRSWPWRCGSSSTGLDWAWPCEPWSTILTCSPCQARHRLL